MSHTGNRLRTVFVSNLASTEGGAEDVGLRSLFSQVGPLVSLRLVTDPATGKRKGYGFIEYPEHAMAVMAVQNFNDFQYQGRPLRLGIAEQDTRDVSITGGGGGGLGVGQPAKRQRAGGAVGMPGSQQQHPGSGAISQLVGSTSREHLVALVQQTRSFVTTQPKQARQLLLSQPQLFSALRLGLDRLYTPPSCDYVASSHAAPMPARGHMAQYPAQQMVHNPYAMQRQGGRPVAAAQAAGGQRAVGMDEHQRLLLEQVRGLTPEQLVTLTPVERQQIEMLKTGASMHM